ncbi:MAG TPA: hypothetical protein VGV38_15795, partial [Pyrinomonadaceae bacterium]|nr:hypothetical protein [Pyrinomonadaceae bacterium]
MRGENGSRRKVGDSTATARVEFASLSSTGASADAPRAPSAPPHKATARPAPTPTPTPKAYGPNETSEADAAR